MRGLQRFLAVVTVLAVLGATLGTLVPRPFLREAHSGENSRHILVLKNDIHTDIAIPIDDAVRRRFAFLAGSGLPLGTPHVSHVVFGWGGRAFYLETPTWSELKPGPLLKALTRDDSVMHVGLTAGARERDPDVVGFDIDPEHFAQLLDFVAASFRQGPGGPVVIPDASYSHFDRFFESDGKFNAIVGCNSWTAAALRAAGLRTGWWNALPVSLWMSLKLYN
ncbi:MAG: TIGR02117 family protein [Alphaproteobacteria bacterium]|nr:TIGR02117 family protein [Alphaproteobacteria bacterium]